MAEIMIYSFKEICTYVVILLVAGFLLPLAFYPVDTWLLYFSADSIPGMIEKNTVYFFLVEFWGFVIITIIKVFLE